MICPKCKRRIEEDDKFCAYCGTKLSIGQYHDPADEQRVVEEKMERLFEELDRVFPDGRIDLSRWNHRKWDEPVAYLCKNFGYHNYRVFLSAYGYYISEYSKEQQSSGKDSKNKYMHKNVPHVKEENKKNKKKTSRPLYFGLVSVMVISVSIVVGIGIKLFIQNIENKNAAIENNHEQIEDSKINAIPSNSVDTNIHMPDSAASTNALSGNSENPMEVYESVLDRYRRISNSTASYDDFYNHSAMYTGMADRIPVEIEGVSSICIFQRNIGSNLIDIDSNGTEELIIGENYGSTGEPKDSIIFDLYTLKDNKPVRIFVSGERYRYYLLRDNTLLFEGSSSAYESTRCLYKYSDGKLELIRELSPSEVSYYEDMIVDLNINAIPEPVPGFNEKYDEDDWEFYNPDLTYFGLRLEEGAVIPQNILNVSSEVSIENTVPDNACRLIIASTPITEREEARKQCKKIWRNEVLYAYTVLCGYDSAWSQALNSWAETENCALRNVSDYCYRLGLRESNREQENDIHAEYYKAIAQKLWEYELSYSGRILFAYEECANGKTVSLGDGIYTVYLTNLERKLSGEYIATIIPLSKVRFNDIYAKNHFLSTNGGVILDMLSDDAVEYAIYRQSDNEFLLDNSALTLRQINYGDWSVCYPSDVVYLRPFTANSCISDKLTVEMDFTVFDYTNVAQDLLNNFKELYDKYSGMSSTIKLKITVQNGQIIAAEKPYSP